MNEVSRQQLWQQEQRALGRCIICAKPAARSKRKTGPPTAQYCDSHLEWQRNYLREYMKTYRRKQSK